MYKRQGNGYEICKKIKAQGEIPVIFLTACDDEVNVVMGLDMGADDYITKPFRIRELLSRIRSVLRRYHLSGQNPNLIDLGELQINTMMAKVMKNGPVSYTHLDVYKRQDAGSKRNLQFYFDSH